MLVFEPEQFRAFAEAAFVRRMTQVLAMLPPGDDANMLPPPATEIAAQLQRARQQGFVEECDCARWVLCAWCLGPDFDSKIASVADLLRRDDIGPSFKAQALEVILRAVFAALANQSRIVL